MRPPLRYSVRVDKDLSEKVQEKLQKSGGDVSETLRSALREFVGDPSGAKVVEVQVFDLLVGAESILRDLADRARLVQPGTPEADAFLTQLSRLLRDLERARKKVRRRVNAALPKGLNQV